MRRMRAEQPANSLQTFPQGIQSSRTDVAIIDALQSAYYCRQRVKNRAASSRDGKVMYT